MLQKIKILMGGNRMYPSKSSDIILDEYLLFSTESNYNKVDLFNLQKNSHNVLILKLKSRKELYEHLLDVSKIEDQFIDIKNMLLRDINRIKTVESKIEIIIMHISFALCHTDLSLLKKYILHPEHMDKEILLFVKDPILVKEESKFFDYILKNQYELAKSYLYHLYSRSCLDKESNVSEETEILANLLYFLLLSKNEREKNYKSFYYFFSYNKLFNKVNTSHKLGLWFELAQILTKKDKNFLLALQCYQKANEELLNDLQMDNDLKALKLCAINNGMALVSLQQSNVNHALQLELDAFNTLKKCNDSRERDVLLFQISINISRIYTLTNDRRNQKKYLTKACTLNQEKKLKFDSLIHLYFVKYFLKNNKLNDALENFYSLFDSDTSQLNEVDLIKTCVELVNQVDDDQTKINLLETLALHLNGKFIKQIMLLKQLIEQIPSKEKNDVLLKLNHYILTVSRRNEMLNSINTLCQDK